MPIFTSAQKQATASERSSWHRKMKNMEKHMRLASVTTGAEKEAHIRKGLKLQAKYLPQSNDIKNKEGSVAKS